MGSDSQELSFVRCPSCRSLVPAVSTRCRMCGAGLGGDAAAKSGDEEKRESRVRQRTMSTPRKEIDSAVSALKEQSERAEEQQIDDDPLGAYLEEVDEAPVANVSQAAAPEKEPAAFGDSDSSEEEDAFDDFDDDDWDFDDLDDDQEEESNEEKVAAKPEPTPLPTSNGKKDLAFAKPAKTVAPIEEDEDEFEEPIPAPAAKAPVSRAPVAQPRKESADALAGWLISFDNPQGVATELRAGKFFVTGSSLKPKDFVLQDTSVSTPHALITVSLSFGISVQDLMSDNGVFVQRRGETGFQKIAEVVAVSHGDRVRFGKVEFLVSCVPGVGGA